MGDRFPRHVGIIMDGNGRWAQAKKFSIIEGHRCGAERALSLIRYSGSLEVKFLTLYTFSSENWERDPDWVLAFLGLLREYFSQSWHEIKEKQVSVRFIGNLQRFPTDLKKMFYELEAQTASNQGLCVLLALGYGGRDEIVRAVQKALSTLRKSDEFSESFLTNNLDSKGIPDPDLIIRTGGEKRLSNFLLWQSAYSELYFSEKLWPDFTEEDFDQALKEFSHRSRRYGL